MADTTKLAKPWYRSLTLWGVFTGLLGAVTTIQATPGIFAPLVTLGILTPAGVATIAAGALVLGPILSAIGRLRPGGGAPLVIATPKKAG